MDSYELKRANQGIFDDFQIEKILKKCMLHLGHSVTLHFYTQGCRGQKGLRDYVRCKRLTGGNHFNIYLGDNLANYTIPGFGGVN